MNKRVLYSLVSGFFTLTLSAAPISPGEALRRVTNDYATRTAGINSYKLAKTIETSTGESAIYLFNNDQGNGYLVLSADDEVVPLLGYSDSGKINLENMPPQLEWWLSEYTNQIEWLRQNVIPQFYSSTTQTVLPDAPVVPMLKTQWDQEYPYNTLCPTVGGVQTPTGCVATSMAQVMNYFKYPEIGSGTISYVNSFDKNRLSMDFSQQPFDWANMLDIYKGNNFTEKEANAVAYLMKACGYATQMQYNVGFSGTYSLYIAQSLINYFSYEDTSESYFREFFSYPQWVSMIYDNLKNIGPVIMGASTENSGHSFVIDGYDGNEMFHINWGWSGISNGYFLLDALNPNLQGTGGSYGGYIFEQIVTLGIQPKKAEAIPSMPANLYQFGNLAGEADIKGELTLYLTDSENNMIVNMSNNPITFSLGVKIESLATGELIGYAECENYQNENLEGGGYGYYLGSDQSMDFLPRFSLANKGLKTNEEYKVTLCMKDLSISDPEWIPLFVQNGMFNYCIVKRNLKGYDVTSLSEVKLKVEDISLLSPLYEGGLLNLNATFINENNADISKTVYLALASMNGRIQYRTDAFLLSLSPEEVLEKKISLPVNQVNNSQDGITEPTDLLLLFLNAETSELYDMTPMEVTMLPQPDNLKVKIDLQFPDAYFNGKEYELNDGSEINVDMTLEVLSGIYSYQTVVYFLVPVENQEYFLLGDNYIIDGLSYVTEGESMNYKFNLSYSDVEPDVKYVVRVGQLVNGNIKWISDNYIVTFGNSGVDTLLSETGLNFSLNRGESKLSIFSTHSLKDVKVFDLTGKNIVLPISLTDIGSELILEGLPKGIYVVKAITTTGESGSIKIAL